MQGCRRSQGAGAIYWRGGRRAGSGGMSCSSEVDWGCACRLRAWSARLLSDVSACSRYLGGKLVGCGARSAGYSMIGAGACLHYLHAAAGPMKLTTAGDTS
jgi:hypothetical protein